jgi:hypothetical protein
MPEYDNIIENDTYGSTLRLVGSGWDNTLVRNVIIEDVNGDGVFLRNVDNVTFENVTIRDVSGDGIKLSIEGSTSNVVISDSDISQIGENGISAGQREGGADHPGLQILNNTISQTGTNGDGDGRYHGMYIQSRDSVIEGNRVSDSEDGNGISVRSSATIRNNTVDSSDGSGIAYYGDHMGDGGTLRIENNTVTDSGYDRRSDIDLLPVPNQGYVVDQVIVGPNFIAQGTDGVRVASGYQNVDLDLDGEEAGASSGVRPLSVQADPSGSDPAEEADIIDVSAEQGGDAMDGDGQPGSSEAGLFVVESGGGFDTVEGFEPGSDRVVIRDFDGFDSIRDLVSRVDERGDDTVIDLGDGDGVILANTSVSQLSTADFLFE